MRFPPAESEIEAFKIRLIKATDELSTLVESDLEKKALSNVQEGLEKAKTDRELTRIHRQMVREFAFYSEGRDLFGPSLTSTDAPAGTYQVILVVEGQSFEGNITIRNDPLLKEGQI
jgi:hypothetical protein